MSHRSSEFNPSRSLRDFLSFLESRNEVIHIARRVNPRFELAALIQDIQRTANKAVIFENVEGFRGRVASNVCGSYQNLALALGCHPQEISNTWASVIEEIPSYDHSVVSKSAVRVTRIGSEEIPKIVFHDKDAGPYMTGGIVISRHPKTGKTNLSFHRVQLTGTDELGIRLSPSGHLFANHKACEEDGQPLPCAILVGNSPLTMLAAATTLSSSVSELDLASHLLGAPWPLRPCQMIDLQIPEDAEMVLEGEILPHVRRDEGPFGEWMGYYAMVAPNHVFRIKGVFAREDPIY